MEKPITSRSDPESRKAYTRWHYSQNKEKYKRRAKEHNRRTEEKIKSYILDYLNDHPCVDCGECDPIVLEFDHKENSGKLFNIGAANTQNYSLKKVIAEIEKCDVRCANCHRRKTYRDFKRTHRG